MQGERFPMRNKRNMEELRRKAAQDMCNQRGLPARAGCTERGSHPPRRQLSFSDGR